MLWQMARVGLLYAQCGLPPKKTAELAYLLNKRVNRDMAA